MTTFEITCQNFKVCKYTGCDILLFIGISIDYSYVHRETIAYSFQLLKEASARLSSDRIRGELALLKIEKTIGLAPIDPMLPAELKQFHWEDNKPKYIRQQHKLAQRHYRRK